MRSLDRLPDLAIVDGHGVAHPRRFGIACHVGVAFGIPSIGCGKVALRGRARDTTATRRGSWTHLRHKGEVIGAAVRTRDGVKPIYVSTGHRVSLATAIRWILRLAPGIDSPSRSARPIPGGESLMLRNWKARRAFDRALKWSSRASSPGARRVSRGGREPHRHAARDRVRARRSSLNLAQGVRGGA